MNHDLALAAASRVINREREAKWKKFKSNYSENEDRALAHNVFLKAAFAFATCSSTDNYALMNQAACVYQNVNKGLGEAVIIAEEYGINGDGMCS